MRQLRLTFFMGLIALAALTSCKRSARRSTVGYVIGPSNEIERYNSADPNPKNHKGFQSSVLISTLLNDKKRKFCSGSLVETTDKDGQLQIQVVTNFHCFAVTDKAGEVEAKLLEEACVQTNIYFGFTQDNNNKVEMRKCALNSLRGDYTGDLAIFSLDNPPPEGFNPLKFWPEDDIPENRPVYIIHYPDVDDHYARIEADGANLPAAAITQEACITKGDFSADEWPLDHTLPFSVKHTCDLIHGSSGSALIDRESGKILGINWGGIELRFKDRTEVFNAATKISYVRAFLADSTGELRADAKRREADAREEESQDGQSGKFDPQKAKSMCGVALGQVLSPQSRWLWLFLLGFPFVFLKRRKKQ